MLCLVDFNLIFLEILDYIKQLDQNLFLFLNGLHHPLLDPLMVFFSGRFTWIPFYAFLLFIIVKNIGFQSLKIILPGVFLVILASDQISYHFFKEVFQRFRPCHNEQIKHLVHLVDGCGGKHGFVSSHATNTFALAVFLGNIIKNNVSKPFSRYFLSLMLLWALMVSYSRIYLGVHYPADIFGGAILGFFIGYLGFKSVKAYIKSTYNAEQKQVV
jgi:undecaprenyl-diphosphatase